MRLHKVIHLYFNLNTLCPILCGILIFPEKLNNMHIKGLKLYMYQICLQFSQITCLFNRLNPEITNTAYPLLRNKVYDYYDIITSTIAAADLSILDKLRKWFMLWFLCILLQNLLHSLYIYLKKTLEIFAENIIKI